MSEVRCAVCDKVLTKGPAFSLNTEWVCADCDVLANKPEREEGGVAEYADKSEERVSKWPSGQQEVFKANTADWEPRGDGVGEFVSASHPHAPDIPPSLAPDGHCRVCRIFVERDDALAELSRLQNRVEELERELQGFRRVSELQDAQKKFDAGLKKRLAAQQGGQD